MDKSYRTAFIRRFLIEALPEPLTPASSHLQLFDNYITNTRLRVRSIRVPETKEWTHVLQQRFTIGSGGGVAEKAADVYLNHEEYEQFKVFEGNEVRKNRYFLEFDGHDVAFDIYLGPLRGLTIAIIEFSDSGSFKKFSTPPFAVLEITNKPFFAGATLVEKNMADVRSEIAGMLAETNKAVGG